MKKSMKAGLCAGLLAVPLFASAGSVFATGVYTQNVTVGNVAETTYSVDMVWGDMSFDYVYSDAPGTYDFKPSTTSCTEYWMSPVANRNPEIRLAESQGRLYSDASCTTKIDDLGATLPNGDDMYPPDRAYYVKEVSGQIYVKDSSANGAIQARVFFAPSQDYSWVTGLFMTGCPDLDDGWCVDYSKGYGGASVFTNIEDGGLLPRYNNVLLYGNFYLSTDGAKHTVTSGDVIGEIEIDIEPAGN